MSGAATSDATAGSVIDPFDRGAELAETGVDPLVAPLDLADVVDGALPLRGERREEHRHPGPDVGRLDGAAPERRRSRDDRAMGIAEDDPGTHPDQLVDEVEPRLEHLLEDQDHPGALGRG